MKLFKLSVLLAALSVLAMAPVGHRAGDADEEPAVNQASPQEPSKPAGPDKIEKKEVALTHPEQGNPAFPTLEKIVEDVTNKLQKRLEDQFTRFLERHLQKQSGTLP
jgi:ABC-type sugar transport system substrate-binding protein